MTMAQPSLVETSGKVRTIRKRPGFLWKMGLRAGVLSVAPRIRGGGFFDDLDAHSNCSVKTLFWILLVIFHALSAGKHPCTTTRGFPDARFDRNYGGSFQRGSRPSELQKG